MKILCISGTLHGIDSNSILNQTIFDGIKKLGHNLDLITFSNSNINIETTNFDKIHVVKYRKNYFDFFRNSIFKMPYLLWINIIRDLFFRPYQKNKLRGILTCEYEIIFALCPPSLSAFLANDIIKINKLSTIKFIQYWSDPLSIGLVDDINKLPLKRLFHKIVEKQALKNADKIIYCTPILCKMQKSLFPIYKEKMRWCDVGYSQKNIVFAKKKVCSSKIKIGYFGSFATRVRNISPLLECMRSIENATLIVRGDSNIKYQVQSSDNIDLKIGRMPVNEILKLEYECDILICLGNHKGVQIPGKTFYYTNFNKPIIYIGDGKHINEISEYLESFNRYLICENNANSIKSAINKAIQILPDFSCSIDERLKPENVASQIIAISKE